MKKTAALFFAATFFTCSISTPANGAVMSGSKCSIKGQIKISQGKKFTCIKSGKKLIWNRGAAISKPISEASSSIAPKEEIQVIDSKWYGWSFRFNKDGVLERRQGGSTIWSSVAERPGQVISPVRSKAFAEIKQFQTMSSMSPSGFKLYFSPNVAEPVVKAFQKYFAKSMSFFTKRLPSGVALDVLIATEKDVDYRRNTLTEILGSSSEAESFIQKDAQMFKQFDIPDPRNTSGGGGVAGTNNSKRFIYTGAVCSCFTDENLLMYNVAHEVTHFYQFASTPSVKKQNFTGSFPNFVEGKIYMPSTLIEGSANTLGSALTVEHVGWYSDQMDWHLGRYKRLGLLKSITSEAEAVKLMKTAATWLPESTTYGDLNYVIGQLQFEYYIATYGMTSYFDLFDNIQKNGDFDSAIKITNGISESDFYSAASAHVMQAYNSINP
jgi:hypothetical protein